MSSAPSPSTAAPAGALATFIVALRAARARTAGERELLREVQAAASDLAARKAEWLTDEMCRPDAGQGFGLHLLHEETDHSLATFVVSWLPGRGTTPHDHGTWAVVAGLRGAERNEIWRRVDARERPGHAEIVRSGERVFGEDELLVMPDGVIHSVWNDSDGVSVSLHVYGRHINHTERSQYDPAARVEKPYKVKVGA
jgi:predicted metal-dependent enzyme (double-stranded beta helix superfamily)